MTAGRRCADGNPGTGTPPGNAPGAGVADGGGPGGERQVPFFCPYCGEEELRPAGNQGGSWDCLACRRGFRLTFAGLIS